MGRRSTSADRERSDCDCPEHVKMDGVETKKRAEEQEPSDDGRVHDSDKNDFDMPDEGDSGQQGAGWRGAAGCDREWLLTCAFIRVITVSSAASSKKNASEKKAGQPTCGSRCT